VNPPNRRLPSAAADIAASGSTDSRWHAHGAPPAAVTGTAAGCRGTTPTPFVDDTAAGSAAHHVQRRQLDLSRHPDILAARPPNSIRRWCTSKLLVHTVLEVPEFHDLIGVDKRRALTPLF